MICKKCGAINPNENIHCSRCGANLSFDPNQRNNKNINFDSSNCKYYKHKDLLTTSLLCIFIPFYMLYLMYCYQDVFYQQKKSTLKPGSLLLINIGGFILSLLLCMIIIGIFGLLALVIFNIYWMYKAASYIKEDSFNSNLPVLCLVFTFVFPPASYILLQSDINKIVEDMDSNLNAEYKENQHDDAFDAEVVEEDKNN